MRVIIAGGRDFSDYDKLRRTVTHLLSRQVEVVVVCGEARGADSLGKARHRNGVGCTIHFQQIGKRMNLFLLG